MAGVDLPMVQERGGSVTSLDLVQRYSDLGSVHKADAVGRIAVP